jgi:hypothetical protein
MRARGAAWAIALLALFALGDEAAGALLPARAFGARRLGPFAARAVTTAASCAGGECTPHERYPELFDRVEDLVQEAVAARGARRQRRFGGEGKGAFLELPGFLKDVLPSIGKLLGAGPKGGGGSGCKSALDAYLVDCVFNFMSLEKLMGAQSAALRTPGASAALGRAGGGALGLGAQAVSGGGGAAAAGGAAPRSGGGAAAGGGSRAPAKQESARPAPASQPRPAQQQGGAAAGGGAGGGEACRRPAGSTCTMADGAAEEWILDRENSEWRGARGAAQPRLTSASQGRATRAPGTRTRARSGWAS